MTNTIIDGAIYSYTATHPHWARGHRYKVLKNDLLIIPTGNRLVLVKALTGPDEGILFACSPYNFIQRYQLEELPVTDEIEQEIEEEVDDKREATIGYAIVVGDTEIHKSAGYKPEEWTSKGVKESPTFTE